ncbi:MAG: hypothetical protein AUJ31_00525 [Parcubacteria group bacterium CG1_02_39_15]|uniref:Type II toxin-antitoxin system mRNA interferase toxin, RelE/StbE family n=4 Tax=Candidatus Nealsoniibacteriota TaxID=1817911 RepID=A0A2G9YSA0_9BACT|nr:MAG: hypothetical protein AUJ31_00525 [Parcubacteria group bacterium CG1_02_39_15]PIP22062.1 MAG: hypothetical protein COX38_02795 [Candidatus Nealsonbacteria bacterium CG23_combo_of_CG06-09_8_20_14_all_39_25]PIQ98413.1 MAG: hypothetical protein COV64_01365 [Candidatus Nealsonbacteria bacterium CG11_big_fil_rev_8_21_14_0_20_39_9]PIW90474.1 MAG: type II toxin-antitoxin system mRNA interferase toxin, RelE/StbE family [Candidatus Nealsonbacteria bacterium CG_4_8_14_3_um_filter_40_11]PIZ88219.1 
MQIIYSSNFVSTYQRLPFLVKKEAEKAEKLFRKNPFDPRLRTHKLKGKLKGRWAFFISWRYRIIFRFANDKTVWFLAIGGHEIY